VYLVHCFGENAVKISGVEWLCLFPSVVRKPVATFFRIDASWLLLEMYFVFAAV